MVNKKTYRVNITGGPGIGKTTILDYASKLGLQVVPEAARIIIEEEQRKDTEILPWKDNYNFQRRVIKLQLELENSYHSRVLLCDRGVFDSPGFCRCAQVQTPEVVSKFSKSLYDLVIIPDQLHFFVNDSVRKENPQQADKIHKAVVGSYREKGFNPLFLPVFPTKQERSDYFIKVLYERGII